MKVIFEYVTVLIRCPQCLGISKASCHGSNAQHYDIYACKEIYILFKKAFYSDKHVFIEYQTFVLHSKLNVSDYV